MEDFRHDAQLVRRSAYVSGSGANDERQEIDDKYIKALCRNFAIDLDELEKHL